MKIQFGLAGTGLIATEYFRGITANPDAEVRAVYSRNPAYAKERLAELGIQAIVYENYEDMVKDASIDAVVLCSTPEVRPEQAIMAANYGKHLVIEKPIALDLLSMRKMAEAIDRSGVRTVVSFVLRWNPMFDMIKSLIGDDALGNIFMAELDYWNNIPPDNPQYKWSSQKDLGVSSMMSAGCHALDALRYFVGEVTEVTAFSCKNEASGFGFDPNVIAMMKLENGGIAKVSSTLECKSPYKLNIQLLGDKGTIVNNQLFSDKFPGQVDYATIPTSLPGSTHHPFSLEIDNFIHAIRNETTTRCDFFDAYKSMELCFAIDESIESGQKITLPME